MRAVRLMAVFVFLCVLAVANVVAQGGEQKIPGFDLNQLDRTADPCTDFYQFVCGGWMKAHPIPADQSSWSRFNELSQRNQEVLHEILEAAAKQPKNALETKIGDFYAACMDTDAIDRKGLAPLADLLRRIDSIKTAAEVPAAVALLHNNGIRGLIVFGAQPDLKDASKNIASTGQGGIGLPDRDDYLKTDERTVAKREAYAKHVQKMFELAGDAPERAAQEMKSVLAIETALANATMDRVAMRDPANRYHPMTRAELAALTPAFSWDRYLGGIGAVGFDKVNVSSPGFLKGVNEVLQSQPIGDVRSYLRWHLLNGAVAMLPDKFINEDFAFNSKVLRGVEEMEPRWKRCTRYTDRDLGELLGQPYVKKTFGPAGKQRTLEMVKMIKQAMEQDIKSLDWMTEETKKAALAKLALVSDKIAYPDKWRDYSKLAVSRSDAMGNILRSSNFEFHRNLERIGKAVDKSQWGMTPPTVNAYYNAANNNINFPAGILQPPFFDKDGDDAVNFGGVGAVVGHELTHGFDDQGAKFDGQGNLRNWWTQSDEAEFKKRTGCIADEYSSFEPLPGVHVNGRLTLGENSADNGGLRLAYMALQSMMQGKTPQTLAGFTPEQRLFLGFGQIWCGNQRPEAVRLQVQTNPHSPGRFRVNGVVQNMPEFQKAWSCKTGQPMVRENACRAW